MAGRWRGPFVGDRPDDVLASANGFTDVLVKRDETVTRGLPACHR